MPDMTAVAQALGAFKALKDIAEAMIGLRDASAFRERQIEFQGKIIEAQSALSALQDERATLIEAIRQREEEIARLKAWDAEKQKYELKDVGHGAFAYVRKPDAEPSEPPHWLCTNCYTEGKKSLFLRTGKSFSWHAIWACPSCAAEISVGFRISPSNPSGELPVPC
jgi:hypothetical protein